jgi:hypothetical protein
VGGCGKRINISYTLERQPSVFTISLAWETSQADEEEVTATLMARARLCACVHRVRATVAF